MKENENVVKRPLSNSWHNSLEEGIMELNQEDREIYLFMRGGFGAK